VRERLPKLIAALAVAIGVAAVLAGLSVFVEAWQASRDWAGSPEAQHAAVPGEAPIWLDAPAPPPAAEPDHGAVKAIDMQAVATPVASPLPIVTAPPMRAPDRDEIPVAARQAPPEPTASADPPAQATPAMAQPGDVELAEVDFRFLDPPEPGAHARLAVSLVNRADAPTSSVSVIVPSRWLQSFTVFGAVPGVLDDRAHGDAERWFTFDGLGPGEQRTLELHVTATAEEVDGPAVRIVVGDDAEIARVKPRTVAPRPRPGPARALSIPKLGVNASVVPVTWEPPPFVVGQLLGTASVSEGNTVLIGHLAGPAGDVFARLSRLRPGDDVVATSRGLEYRFMVSDIAVKPYDDLAPTQQTGTPRLTLMTCTGQWSLTRQDYSHRLWIVAEPPELAQQTIRANAERAAQAAREAEAAAAARATHEAEAGSSPPEPEVPLAEPRPVEALLAAEPALSAAAAAVPEPATVVVADAVTPAPDSEELAPGISIDSPADGAAVARRVTVRGRRTAEADPNAPLWLLVRAEVAGSRWYAFDRPLEPNRAGVWQVEVELGGPPGLRHEIRVGPVDASANAELRRHAAERPGQPLDDLPAGFRTGARIDVERR
jgi:LPXTG-site transpeptidase (sortase) family protein